MPITIPKHEPIKKVYVEMVREIVESAISNALDEKKAWLEAALEEGVEIHEPDSLEDYSGQFNNRSKNSFTSIGDGMNCTFEHVCSNL